MNEAEWLTRKKRIDTKLRSLSPQWQIIRYHEGLDLSSLHCVAVNDLPHTSHADQLVKTCRDVFNQGDYFMKKITGNANMDCPRCPLSASTGERVRVRCRSGVRPSCIIREFRNRPNPKVVVTVDMLSTGVDIPALEFIVFLRPVKSRILWEQMLGRGTRLCPDINKSKFVVFDCFDGTLIRYFKNVSSFDIEPPGRTPLTLPEVIENIWQNVDRDYHVRILAKRLLRVDKEMNADAPSAKDRAGFVLVNVSKKGHSCWVKITEYVRNCAAEQGIAEEEALKNGMEGKSKEFVEKGAEVYAKA